MFPFFPFGPMPPFAFLFPFHAMAGMMGVRRDGDTADRDARPGAGAAMPFGVGGPAGMMTLAMAPFALGSQLAQVVEDAGHVAAQVRESLERDEGPVHVMVGDPDGPLGLAIGLTFMTRGERPALQNATAAAPRLATVVDVTAEPTSTRPA